MGVHHRDIAAARYRARPPDTASNHVDGRRYELPSEFGSIAVLVALLLVTVVVAAAVLDVLVVVVSVLGAVIGLCTALVTLRNLVIAGRTAVIAQRTAVINEHVAVLQLHKTELDVEAAAALRSDPSTAIHGASPHPSSIKRFRDTS